jgi:superfamily II DNA or RNA helicase
VIFCAPQAVRFNGEPLGHALNLTESIEASRPHLESEIREQFSSPHLRASDVPLAFHRESPGLIHGPNAEMAAQLEAYGRILQYRFSDGLILYASQVLYHRYSRKVPRHLLPLNINISSDLKDRVRFGRLTAWQVDADQTILSVLLAAARNIRLATLHSEVEAVKLEFCLDENKENTRNALELSTVELRGDEWGPWRLSTALHDPVSGVHCGRARIELDPTDLGGNLAGLSQTFLVDVRKRRLVFHGFEDQLQRLRTHLSTHPEESGLSLHLSGHAQIQLALTEMNDLIGHGMGQASASASPSAGVRIYPDSFTIANDKITSRLLVSTDGTFRFQAKFTANGDIWESHGLPQSSAYILLNLQHGLASTTGYPTTHIAHARKGLKRDRDMKVLRSIGFATLIFYDAVNFALGRALSDDRKAANEKEVCESLFERIGALILKSEGWPVQAGSLNDLCSKNVTTLIEGFVKQVVADIKGRDVCLYLPSGEFRLQGFSRIPTLLFHALVADLLESTKGACISRARTNYFEHFMHGRATIDQEDMAVRHAVDPELNAKMIYQPGINERYRFPEAANSHRGDNVMSLINQGFELAIDGKLVEEFDAADFRPEFTVREGQGPLDGAITTGGFKIDWFELNPKFFFKGAEITGEQAARLSREGLIEFQGKLYRVKTQDMPQLTRLNRFWASIQTGTPNVLKGAKRRKTEDTFYPLPRSQTLELLALRASGVKVRGGQRWDQIAQFYDSLDLNRAELKQPDSLKTRLQPYQVTGVQWLRDLFELGLGGILADDMGLGKTVTTLAFLELLRLEDKMGPTLVLVPTSLTYNWLAETTRFTPDLPVAIYSSRDPEAMLEFVRVNQHSLVICTYGLLQENDEIFQQVNWNCLIFDEAQNLKNITTKRTTSARKLHATFKVCLTGTPLENHYGELYSLFDLIVPGALGDLPSFRERYVNPVRVLRDDIDFLRLKIRPLLMRRTKAQVMHELPPKHEATLKLPFEDEQRRIYRDIASSYNEQVRKAIATQGEARTQLQMLTALLRLRQVCSDPSSVPGVRYQGEPPKITTLLEALGEVVESGASALIFTQFLSTFERIRASLSHAKIRHFDISGADSRVAREKKIRGFQDSNEPAVMLMTLKTGGVGLNLVKASYIFHIEPWWNPAVENQATDRAHRIGQTKTVQVYRYLIKDSVEEKIEILKDIKAKRFDALFAVSETESEFHSGSSALSQRDFEFLLS